MRYMAKAKRNAIKVLTTKVKGLTYASNYWKSAWIPREHGILLAICIFNIEKFIFCVLLSLHSPSVFLSLSRQAPSYSARIRKCVKWCGRWGVRMQQAPSRGLAPMAGVHGTSSRMTMNRRQVAVARHQTVTHTHTRTYRYIHIFVFQ